MIGKRAFLGHLALSPIRDRLSDSAVEKRPDSERSKKLRAALLKDDPTGIRIGPGMPNYHPHDPVPVVTIREGEEPHALAHELGHAEIDRGMVGRVVQSRTMRLSATLVAAVGATAALHRGNPTVGAAILASAFLPLLTAEGWASFIAMRRLREVGATDEELSLAREKLVKGWASYATRPVGAAADVLTGVALGRILRA